MSELFEKLVKNEMSLQSAFVDLKQDYGFSCNSFECSGLPSMLKQQPKKVKHYNKEAGRGDKKKKIKKVYYGGLICEHCDAIYNPFSETGFEDLGHITDFLKFIDYCLSNSGLLVQGDTDLCLDIEEKYSAEISQDKLNSYREMLYTYMSFYGFLMDRPKDDPTFTVNVFSKVDKPDSAESKICFYDALRMSVKPKIIENGRVVFSSGTAPTKEKISITVDADSFNRSTTPSKFNNVNAFVDKLTGNKHYRLNQSNKLLITSKTTLTTWEEYFLMIDNVLGPAEMKVKFNSTIAQFKLRFQEIGFDELFHFIFINGSWVNRSKRTKQPQAEPLKNAPMHLLDFKKYM